MTIETIEHRTLGRERGRPAAVIREVTYAARCVHCGALSPQAHDPDTAHDLAVSDQWAAGDRGLVCLPCQINPPPPPLPAPVAFTADEAAAVAFEQDAAATGLRDAFAEVRERDAQALDQVAEQQREQDDEKEGEHEAGEASTDRTSGALAPADDADDEHGHAYDDDGASEEPATVAVTADPPPRTTPPARTRKRKPR